MIVSALDVGMPCGKPAYVFNVLFLASFADRRPVAQSGRGVATRQGPQHDRQMIRRRRGERLPVARTQSDVPLYSGP